MFINDGKVVKGSNINRSPIHLRKLPGKSEFNINLNELALEKLYYYYFIRKSIQKIK